MPRRITVECTDGHKEEIIIGINDRIPRCGALVCNNSGPEMYDASGRCRKKREIVWDEKGPGFRVQGMTKNFR